MQYPVSTARFLSEIIPSGVSRVTLLAINLISIFEASVPWSLNNELKKLAYHNNNYSVNLGSNSINFNTFIDQLSLGAKTGEINIGLGGDGRNNQLLMALWKIKSEKEHNSLSEAIIYCIEEPESHLHPHQQRKISEYLINELKGQVIVTTHSPQITAEFRPDSIIRLIEKNGKTTAANNGCSKCIEDSWQAMGYRMSIILLKRFLLMLFFSLKDLLKFNFIMN